MTFVQGYDDYRNNTPRPECFGNNEYEQGWGAARRGSVLGRGRYAYHTGAGCPCTDPEDRREWQMGVEMEQRRCTA